MKFRTQSGLGIKVIDASSTEELENKVEEFGEKHVFEDFQYSTSINDRGIIIYSIVVLYRKTEVL